MHACENLMDVTSAYDCVYKEEEPECPLIWKQLPKEKNLNVEI
jgi:hypothetical protein